jgi:light-regulated signal transduction histidine kinase (bacteriophytochrome)
MGTVERHEVTAEARDVAAAVEGLRSPLATLRGALETLVQHDGELSGDVRAVVTRVAYRHALLLGHRFDALALHQRLGTEAATEPVDRDLRSEVDDVVAACAPMLRDQPVEVDVASATWVHVAPDALALVLANLVADASRHGDPRVPIVVTATPDGDDVRTVVSRAAAHGEDAPRPVDALAPGGWVDRTAGGMPVVRRLVASWGGTLDVDVRPGLTVRTAFTLPRSARRATVDLAVPGSTAEGQ